MDVNKMKERFEYFLNLRGLTLTRERKWILDAVLNMSRHFNVDDIYFALRAAGQKTSAATIYRTLQLLTESRMIRQSDLSGKVTMFELTEPGINTGVMVCEHCGRTHEFRGPVIDRFIHEAAAINQFLPMSTTIKLSGFCNECVKSNPPSLRKEVCVPFLKYAQSRDDHSREEALAPVRDASR